MESLATKEQEGCALIQQEATSEFRVRRLVLQGKNAELPGIAIPEARADWYAWWTWPADGSAGRPGRQALPTGLWKHLNALPRPIPPRPEPQKAQEVDGGASHPRAWGRQKTAPDWSHFCCPPHQITGKTEKT
jgi:hypothetical protein